MEHYYLNIKNDIIISSSNLELIDNDITNLEVSKAVFDDYRTNRNKYYVVNGELKVKTPIELEEEKKLEEQEKLAKTYMTKWDFVKYILNPHNFTYAMLKDVLAKDVALEEAWACCSYVYRGDDTLCTNLPKLLPTVTTAFLDEAFKNHGTYGG